MNILITGGCGYVGTSLIKKLLEQNHKITNIDAMWFGNNLQKNKNLINIREDIRYFKFNKLNKFDTVIHLANIANDPSVELNPQLSWEVNVLAIIKILDFCVQKKNKTIYLRKLWQCIWG